MKLKAPPYLYEMGLGVVLAGLISWAYTSKALFSETINLKTYDLFSSLRAKSNKTPLKTDEFRIIEIDDKSVSVIGRWPWSRGQQAELLDEIVANEAKLIGMNVIYADSDHNQGLDEMGKIQKSLSSLLEKNKSAFKKRNIRMDEFNNLLEELNTSMEGLNGDAIMARSIEEAGNVVLPMFFEPGEGYGQNLEPLSATFEKEKLSAKIFPNIKQIPPAENALLPMDSIGSVALAIGHSNLTPDVDGTLRRMAPFMRYGDKPYPSFGLQLLREAMKEQRDAYRTETGKGIALSNVTIPLDQDGKVFIEFNGPAGSFQHYSAIDLLSGAVPENALKKKIVLVGVTATGGADTFVGPSGDRYTGLEIWANHLANITNQRFIVSPPWSGKAEWGMIILSALIVILLLPMTRAKISIPVASIVFIALVAAPAFIFVKKGIWVSPSYAILLLISGFALFVGKRLIFTERGRELMEMEGMETNKMLGLSFQGQGMLDLAFEKFRRCPVDSSMKELLYNLGLDMERKRQFSKAAAVFEHIAHSDPKYKDIQDKITLLKKAGEGAVFGSIGKKGNDATVVVDGLSQHTTLGRYEVMKELGRGAMGIVYLGRDPKINRQVAIKTLRFEDDLDEEQTRNIKERFFREAESAGNLTHPNIVRIFDAGEDQEVAYIAMELLEGTDLKRHCEKGNLLPPSKVIDIVAQIAEGLDYAHKQGVVHRDIKPGNIMLLKDDSLRITDFGIARIQAASKTATGTVLGTPAYMSPEQVNGKKADGRADIFSLGVTLYELLTGEKPFQAESIAALLYRIANVDHPDPREYNPQILPHIVEVLKKALAKEADQRYQSAGELAHDLRKTATQAAAAPLDIEQNSLTKPSTPIIEKEVQSAAVPHKGKVLDLPAEDATQVENPIQLGEPLMNDPALTKPKEENLGDKFFDELEKTFNVVTPGNTGTQTKEMNPLDPPDFSDSEKTIVLEKKPQDGDKSNPVG